MPAKNPIRKDGETIYSHIYNVGVEKRIIFNDEEDYKVFLGFLKDYLTAPQDPESIKKVFTVHGRTFRGTPHQPKNYFNKMELVAYSLMPNHFHLLLHQITRGSLESFIRSLCTRYSMYFNKKYQHTGGLFKGPYKSVQIDDKSSLTHLTRFFHHSNGHSSYAEYLGSRVTSWVKPKVVQSFFDKVKTDLFKEAHSYKGFVENYELNQKENELLEGITFDGDTQQHLERRDLARNVENYPPEPNSKPRPRIPEFIAAFAIFLLLVSLGIRNINASATKSSQPLPTPAVLAETKEVSTAPADAVKPKIILTVEIDEGSASVNIRQKPTTDSEKIGKAKNGDTFEFIAIDSEWYEVKLADGSTGFISAEYITKNDQ